MKAGFIAHEKLDALAKVISFEKLCSVHTNRSKCVV
jgi:hypothetical protein